jgi:hypothetical protein
VGDRAQIASLSSSCTVFRARNRSYLHTHRAERRHLLTRIRRPDAA